MKLTQNRIESLIDTLNDLICDERSLTREQRENMVRTVAILGGLGERQRLIAAEDEALEVAGSGKKAEKAQKPREPNAVFPRTGKPWQQDDLELIHSIVDDIPDDEIDEHILWLSRQQGRTPYAIALKIVGEGRLNEEWAKTWKAAAKKLREEYALSNGGESSSGT